MNSAARAGASGPPQVPGLHEPHRDEQCAFGLTGLMHRDDVRVIDRGRRPRLGDEPPPEPRVRRQPRRQDFQCHEPAQPLVAGPEHHRHTARADLRLQPVPRHQRARPEPGQPREILAQCPSPPAHCH